MSAVMKADGNTDWDGLLKSIAEGRELADAMQDHRLTSADITATTLDPGQAQRYFEARMAGRRRNWSPWVLEDVAQRVARGLSVSAAVVEVKGQDESPELFELLEHDSAWNARFAAARRAGAQVMGEGLLAIADDKSGDVLETPKGPIPSSAAVGRSKLMVETRALLMKAYDPERWAEKKPQTNVQVNVNYAETLEAARERSKVRHGTPRGDVLVTREQRVRAVDATFTVSEPAADVEPAAMPDAMRAAAAALPATEPEQAADAARAAAVAWMDEPTKSAEPEEPAEEATDECGFAD
jgi:terminase small subunit-like protein